LWDLVQLLWQSKELTDEELDTIIETINSRVVDPDDIEGLLHLCPRAVVLRNVVKPFLSMYLAKNHAQKTGARFTYWRAEDKGSVKATGGSQLLSESFLSDLGTQDASKTGGMDTWMAFFVGCHYIFTSNDMPELGWFNNGTCVGVKLLLHPDEPPDDLSKPFRVLKYQPRAVIVRPTDIDIGDLLADDNVPSGCIPVAPQCKKFEV